VDHGSPGTSAHFACCSFVWTTVLFAGGQTAFSLIPRPDQFSSVVDVYDEQAGIWSTASLSLARSSFAAASLPGVAMFAGGFHRSGSRMLWTFSEAARLVTSRTRALFALPVRAAPSVLALEWCNACDVRPGNLLPNLATARVSFVLAEDSNRSRDVQRAIRALDVPSLRNRALRVFLTLRRALLVHRRLVLLPNRGNDRNFQQPDRGINS